MRMNVPKELGRQLNVVVTTGSQLKKAMIDLAVLQVEYTRELERLSVLQNQISLSGLPGVLVAGSEKPEGCPLPENRHPSECACNDPKRCEHWLGVSPVGPGSICSRALLGFDDQRCESKGSRLDGTTLAESDQSYTKRLRRLSSLGLLLNPGCVKSKGGDSV